jgi:hypothetical protein
MAPSLFRDGSYLRHEDVMLRELLVYNPLDFSSDMTTLDVLVRMQHHSMPTRLLDITSNPLIALYFACKGHRGGKTAGQVIVLKVPENDIKFFDSDTASCIANLAKLTGALRGAIGGHLSEFERFNTLPYDEDTYLRHEFNQQEPVQKLLYYIRQERSYFIDNIRPLDLRRIICVRSKMNNSRILSQSGAFLLFGLNARLDAAGKAGITIERIDIDPLSKARIVKELDLLNINESTVFPFLETSAKYIASKYKTRIRPRLIQSGASEPQAHSLPDQST